MKYKSNPKFEGSNLIGCTPQEGPCIFKCNQCYYNRDKSLWKPNIPKKRASKGKIVRMNALNDSNMKRSLVLREAKKYKDVFFNTSVFRFDFPGPVVYTANSEEEKPVEMDFLRSNHINNVMFIRLRVSSTNLVHIDRAVRWICEYSSIPIVLTFMAYYNKDIETTWNFPDGSTMLCYVWKVRHVNEYYCPTIAFRRYVLKRMQSYGARQVTMCGTLDSNYRRDCHNCEIYYWIVKRKMLDTQLPDELGRIVGD